jgi:hypothetical protein
MSNGAKIIKITPEMSVEIFKNSNSNSSEKGSDTNTICVDVVAVVVMETSLQMSTLS